MENNKLEREKVLIIGLDLFGKKQALEESLDELEELVKAAGGQVIARLSQSLPTINASYYIGKGKAEEIKNYCHELDISTVVFNDELSGAQTRNLEKLIDRKIVDRTNLILDIFATRADSKEGRLQVKLAQLQYRLPRLVGYRDYLSREGGGIGTRGPGEQKLEVDRRHILREITNIKKDLEASNKVRDLKRKKRLNSNLPIVALVGYTNAGKSTLINQIVGDDSKELFTKDMLFATLDTSLRRGQLKNGQDFLLTDTVGFVSKLPTNLVEAFKATLEEVKYADLIVHLIDGSNPDLDIQINTTMDILKDLDVLSKPIVNVFNKMDKIDIKDLIYDPLIIERPMFISAKGPDQVDKLLDRIQEDLPQKFKKVNLKLPYTKQDLVSYFMDSYQVEDLEYEADGTRFTLEISLMDYKKYEDYII